MNGQPDEEIHRLRVYTGKVQSIGASDPMELGCYHLPCTWLSSPTRKVPEPHPTGIFMEASSRRHDNFQLFSHLKRMRGWGWKAQVSNHGLVPGTRPQPGSLQELRAASLGKQTLLWCGKNKGFRSLVSGTGVKNQTLEQKILLRNCQELGTEADMYFLWSHSSEKLHLLIVCF